MTRVYVGMSGGVDSSLTAALLVEQGYEVTGVYMKNWSQDLPGMKCPWADDLADAKRVAVQLGIEFKVFDFEREYKQRVVDYMIDEYELGRTPNPDIMCNQEVKFRLFLDAALADGADMIATGHYARVVHAAPDEQLIHSNRLSPTDAGDADSDSNESAVPARLALAQDVGKDQTYFLYRVTEKALEKTLFPLGGYTKAEVREMARERGLYTAAKRDSQGICFVGQIGIREFLSQYVTTKPGDIVDTDMHQVLGRHDGAIYYTLGQRHGLDVGGGLPYYVVGKDMEKNEVYVSTNLNDTRMWRHELTLTSLHWINQPPQKGTYRMRVRHRAPLVPAQLVLRGDNATLVLDDAQRAATAGQSVVLYDDNICIGGGIIVS
jgi:tRNA-specific 2-thiouridylase